MKKKANEDLKSSEYEFCRLCKINHNQGRRHNYYPRHTNSLSSLLSRFHKKLSDVKTSLKNPSSHLPSHQSMWCIFCDFDIDESGSAFVSGNAIKHLASKDHLKNLKHFFWKYGGGVDKLDSFRVSEAEFAKWEKKCLALKDFPSSSKIHHGLLHGQLNDIQTNNQIIDDFNSNNIHFLESSFSKDVLPLQYSTNENYQIYHSDISQDGRGGSPQHNIASDRPSASESNVEMWRLTCQSRQHPLTSSAASVLSDGLAKEGEFPESIRGGEPIIEGCQSLTRISSGGLGDRKGNVHSGAPPPWLERFESCNEHGKFRKRGMIGAQKLCKKTNRLNPKRVGAAWAEKRKLEMEMEKRGEIVANVPNADWLPNFGRVWQSGSRKESMKAFIKEKSNRPEAESQTESEVKIHPYVSKRMRQDINDNSDVQQTGDTF